MNYFNRGGGWVNKIILTLSLFLSVSLSFGLMGHWLKFKASLRITKVYNNPSLSTPKTTKKANEKLKIKQINFILFSTSRFSFCPPHSTSEYEKRREKRRRLRNFPLLTFIESLAKKEKKHFFLSMNEKLSLALYVKDRTRIVYIQQWHLRDTQKSSQQS